MQNDAHGIADIAEIPKWELREIDFIELDMQQYTVVVMLTVPL